MTGFRAAPPLRELARSPAGHLEAALAAHERSEQGPDPVHAFLAFSADAPSDPPSEGPLRGVPVAIKDNLATLDFPTTCGSRLLEGYRSPFQATAVRRLRAAGAIIVGKTNMDELGMGSSTEHSAYGASRNPADRSRVPGGSSGGSAAAVAAGIVPVALGSETGGSVRQPAAFCGVVGLTPTYGAISRYGLVAFASSLDRVGILGRTVDDVAYVLGLIAGPDPLDATSADGAAGAAEPPAVRAAAAGRAGEEAAIGDDLSGVVIGVPRELFPPTLHPGIARESRAAIRRLAALGAEIRDVSLPHAALGVPAYHAITAAEASSNLARLDGARFGVRADGESVGEMYGRTRALFGPEVKRRILLGAHLLSAGDRLPHHRRAVLARRRIAGDYRAVFLSGVHAIFAPTTATPAFRLGERLADPREMYESDTLTVGSSLAGLPSVSVPIGLAGGLPAGGQLIGSAWDEANLLRLASALERASVGSPREA